MRRPGRQHDGAIVARASRTRASMRHVAGSAAARGRRTSSSSVCRGAGNINRCNTNERFSRHRLGNSHGRYDGDTLVVETTNYRAGFTGSSPDVRVTERFTRVSADYRNWVLAVDDSKTWTAPWSFMIRLKRSPDQIDKYACHEGNYSLPGIVGSARA